ncbi:zinc ribbon domain-containing protein [Clostridium perfringens]|uniref:zinc ribbon domain-containing protein n=1 Tax=Clostridium perfringens TaxID=1502 RepID=UPI0006C12EC8|nr:zinc ribbon domain-containing protein [Clostridium perfringens]MCX0373328.1 zinc ribbon domain-containing protein [Clostridium perfringens]MDH5067054.1 hypothetical protein [Clostridium perfringens]CUO44606.1 Uncharacterised protein [Clostridium perfringens]VTQ56112.1 Uncharacterised protein [Clostridium perfringens]
MYCSKCGKEIPNESVFCPECGCKCKSDMDNKIRETSAIEIKELITKVICNPISTVKNEAIKLSSQNKLIYIIITSLITPLITIFSFKTYGSGLVKYIINSIPMQKVYILNLGSYIINYVLLLGIIYILFKSLMKDKIDKTNAIDIMLTISTFNMLLEIIAAIVLFLGVIPWVILKVFSMILLIILMYSLLNSLLILKEKLIYIYSTALVVIALINMWFVFKNVGSIISDMFFSNFLKFM